MPIGNYVPNFRNKNKITYVEVEEFILSLLKDITTESSNTLLSQNTIVNYGAEYSLAELDKSGIKFLLSFMINPDSLENVNLNQTIKDDGETIRVNYSIGLMTKKDSVSYQEFLQVYQEVVNAITDNWNGTSSSPTGYEIELSSGKKLFSDLTQNKGDIIPNIEIAQDNEQINYLTAINNISFTISVIY